MTDYDDRRRQRIEERRAIREESRRTPNRYTVEGSGRRSRSSGYGQYDRGNYAGRSTQRSGRQAPRNGQRSRQQASRQRDGQQRTAARQNQKGAGRAMRSRAAQQDARGQRQTALDRFAGEQAARRLPSIPIAKIGIVVVAILVLVLVVRACSAISPIDVTINGTPYELRGEKTLGKALEASGLPINPGDFISLDGNVITPDQGEPFTATVNEETSSDPQRALANGDVITFTDGADIVEEYDAVEEPVPYGVTLSGMGAIHLFTEGVDGVKEIRTGRSSGAVVEKQTVDPQNLTVTYYNPNVGSDKVVAFTFDDGPSSTYTEEVLDILKQNDVRATFFALGTEIEDGRQDILRRAKAEGHQICTHTYDHADPAGGADIGAMSAQGQIDEIEKGRKVITDTLGEEASRVVRLPGGNMSEEVIKNIHPYVTAEIGWNVDTLDWTMPGADAIYESMVSAKPGEVVLCHDSGGDRSETVAALKKAVPELKEKGYTFITIDELLAYPQG